MKNISLHKFFAFGFMFAILTLIGLLVRDAGEISVLKFGAHLQGYHSLTVFLLTVSAVAIFLKIYREDNLEKIMYGTILLLLGYFLIFHWLIYPNLNQLQSMGGISEQIAVWSIVAYRAFAALWGSFVLTYLLWALANQSYTVSSAKLSYPLLTLFSSVGYLFPIMSEVLQMFPAENGSKFIQISGYLLALLSVLFIFNARYLNRVLRSDPLYWGKEISQPQMNRKFNIHYILFILLLVFAYRFCNQTINFLWTAHMAGLAEASSPGGYNSLVGRLLTYQGILSFIIFLSTFWFIKVFGWLKSAFVPPIFAVFGVTFALFANLFPIIGDFLAGLFSISNMMCKLSVLGIIKMVLVGLVWALFFTTINIAYIPLAKTIKARGKLIIDLLFAHIGYGVSAFLISFFETVMPSQTKPGSILHLEAPLLIIALIVTIIWIFGVRALGKRFNSLEGASQ